jgi:arsenate reductase (thioredoxin)
VTTASDRRVRVLFVCTGNSARSQMAEALLNWKGRGRFQAESAGSEPAARVNPLALATLREHDVPWTGRPPRRVEGLERVPWDIVITVCDQAKEACPIFPARALVAHWSMPDPAEAGGDEVRKRDAFRDAFRSLSRRIDLLLELPLDTLERVVLEAQIRAIGERSL